MTPYPVTAPARVRRALATRSEIALLDVRSESSFAQGHPLFAAQLRRAPGGVGRGRPRCLD